MMRGVRVVRPFSLRLRPGAPAREFAAGRCAVNEEECGHWFFRACLAEGRAVLEPGEEGATPPESPEFPESPEPAGRSAQGKSRKRSGQC